MYLFTSYYALPLKDKEVLVFYSWKEEFFLLDPRMLHMKWITSHSYRHGVYLSLHNHAFTKVCDLSTSEISHALKAKYLGYLVSQQTYMYTACGPNGQWVCKDLKIVSTNHWGYPLHGAKENPQNKSRKSIPTNTLNNLLICFCLNFKYNDDQ